MKTLNDHLATIRREVLDFLYRPEMLKALAQTEYTADVECELMPLRKRIEALTMPGALVDGATIDLALAYKALSQFTSAVDVTGGVMRDRGGLLAPATDDLGEAYGTACAALDVQVKTSEEKEDPRCPECDGRLPFPDEDGLMICESSVCDWSGTEEDLEAEVERCPRCGSDCVTDECRAGCCNAPGNIRKRIMGED